MNTQEREFVLDQLHNSRERLRVAVTGLSPEQQIFRPAEDQWSLADCLEHIALVEGRIFQGIQGALQQPPAPEKQAEVKDKTSFISRFVPDRSTRVKGPEMVMPRRDWKIFSELTESFEAARNRTLAFASQTEADLHSHFFPHFVFKDLDCYQWLLMISLHCERHVLQMEEVKASQGYPALT